MEVEEGREELKTETHLRRAEREAKRFLNPVPTTVGGWSTLCEAFPQYLAKKKLEAVPSSPLGPFTTDAALYEVPPSSGLRVTWMGHSTLLLEIDGVRILTDPVWDERASPLSWAGPKRFFPAPLPLKHLPHLDAVLVSHDHYDHLGEATILQMAGMDAFRETEWVTSLGVGQVLEQYGVAKRKITELDWTDSHTITGQSGGKVELTSVPSRHFSGRGLLNRFETLWGAFVLRSASHNIYFGADSGWWPGFAEIGQVYGPFDLTMLEIGAYDDLWKEIHLGPDGAARAFKELGDRGLLMPIHWGLFDLALHAWRQPIERMVELASAKGIPLWSPVPGAPSEVVAGEELRSDWWHPKG